MKLYWCLFIENVYFWACALEKQSKETAWERGITTSSFTTLNSQNTFFRRYQRNILFFIDFFSGKNNVNNTNKHLDHHLYCLYNVIDFNVYWARNRSSMKKLVLKRKFLMSFGQNNFSSFVGNVHTRSYHDFCIYM